MSLKAEWTIECERYFAEKKTNVEIVGLLSPRFPNLTYQQLRKKVKHKREQYNKNLQKNGIKPASATQNTPSSAPPVAPSKSSPQSEYREDVEKGEAEISQKTYTQIKTLEALIEECQIDTAVWDIERWICNKWEVGAKDASQEIQVTPLYQIKVWLKKKSMSKSAILTDFKAELLQSIREITPPLRTQIHQNNDGVLLEIDIFDPHFGKLSWSEETGEDYDISIAEQRYFNALYDLIEKASTYKTKQILLPMGNDFFHYDTIAITTTAGTRQDSDSRWQKMFRKGVQIAMKAIDICRQVAPVEVLHVPSNHDTQSGFYLAELLRARYEVDLWVNVDAGLKCRKYFRFGKCGIGFAHGHNEKHADLPLIMMRETQKEWFDVDFREWHLGHFHSKKETKYLAFNEAHGISVRIIRSLSAPDAWHFEKGYVQGLKGAEGFIWDAEYGNVANISSILI